MPITTVNDIAAGLAQRRQPLLVNKASIANAAAGQFFALWRATGQPGQGAIPGAAAVCDGATLAGAMPFTAPTGGNHSYLAGVAIAGGNAGADLQVHDRLAHNGTLNGTLTTAQTVGVDLTATTANLPARIGAADYSDVAWWIEIYTDLGATGVNATCAVTYDDGSTGNIAAVALGATPRASRRYPLVSAVAGRYIRAVTSLTLSATSGAVGNFGVTATRPLATVPITTALVPTVQDWTQTLLPRVHDNACLELMAVPSTTTTGTFVGRVILIQS